MVGDAPERRVASSTPAAAENAPAMAKVIIFTLITFTPLASAADSPAPIAFMWRPSEQQQSRRDNDFHRQRKDSGGHPANRLAANIPWNIKRALSGNDLSAGIGNSADGERGYE
mgnify:CR=1 FL=1